VFSDLKKLTTLLPSVPYNYVTGPIVEVLEFQRLWQTNSVKK